MKVKKLLTENILLLFLVSIFLLDILNKIYTSADSGPSIFIKAIKTIFELFFLGFLFMNWKSTKRFIYFLICLAIIFLIGQIDLILNLEINQFRDIELLRYFLLYLFPLVYIKFLEVFPAEIKISQSKLNQLETFFLLILTINTICIFSGLLFEIPFFKTYSKSRWGYMGLMPRSITASYFYIISIIFLYTKATIKGNLKFKFLLFITIIGAILIGTKSIYLFLALLLGYHIVSKKYYKLKSFYASIVGVSLILFVFYDFIIKNVIQRYFSVLYNLYEEKGWLTAAASFRDEIFKENLAFYIEKWNLVNYIFGGRIFESALFENSIIDLIIFFGVGGSVLYLHFLYKKLILGKNIFIQINLMFILLISILAGQFFSNISAMAYIGTVLFLINKKQTINL